jgi:hypothetical protein
MTDLIPEILHIVFFALGFVIGTQYAIRKLSA